MINRGSLARTMLLTAALLALLLSGCSDRETPAPVPLSESLPRSMKGYELYSWRSGQTWHFTLVTGTNRLKSIAEVTSAEQVVRDDWVKVTLEGVPELKDALQRLAPSADVLWTGAPDLSRGSLIVWARLALPPRSIVDDIRSQCTALGIRLDVSDR